MQVRRSTSQCTPGYGSPPVVPSSAARNEVQASSRPSPSVDVREQIRFLPSSANVSVVVGPGVVRRRARRGLYARTVPVRSAGHRCARGDGGCARRGGILVVLAPARPLNFPDPTSGLRRPSATLAAVRRVRPSDTVSRDAGASVKIGCRCVCRDRRMRGAGPAAAAGRAGGAAAYPIPGSSTCQVVFQAVHGIGDLNRSSRTEITTIPLFALRNQRRQVKPSR